MLKALRQKISILLDQLTRPFKPKTQKKLNRVNLRIWVKRKSKQW